MTDNSDNHWEKIAAKLHGELTGEEEAEFTRMITGSAGVREFEKVQQIHDSLNKTGPIPADGRMKSWAQVENGIKAYQLKWIKSALKYAAIVAVAFIAGNLLKHSAPDDKEIRYSEITVPFGQMSQIKLSDGTNIWLNSGTTLSYPERFAENSRSVSVVGEAFFEVAEMSDKPFTVSTAEMKVVVTGTSFNLSAYTEDEITSVTLVEGQVEVQNTTAGAIATLYPGQMATKNRNETDLKIRDVETSFYAAWKEGKIFFDDEPLDQIAIKLERWFNVEITFADDNLKSHRFTGTILRNKPVDQIMLALELLAPISFKHQVNTSGKDKITIFKRT